MQPTLNRQAELLKSLHTAVGKTESCVMKLEADCAQNQTKLAKYDDKLIILLIIFKNHRTCCYQSHHVVLYHH